MTRNIVIINLGWNGSACDGCRQCEQPSTHTVHDGEIMRKWFLLLVMISFTLACSFGGLLSPARNTITATPAAPNLTPLSPVSPSSTPRSVLAATATLAATGAVPVETVTPAEAVTPNLTPGVSDTPSGIPTPVCSLFRNPVAFSPDNKRILLQGNEGAQVLNLMTGTEQVLIPTTRSVVAAALSPNGAIVALALEDYSIHLYRASNGNQTAVLSGHTGLISSLDFNQRSDQLVSGAYDGTVRIWNADQGKQTGMIKPTGGNVTAVSFSPDGSKLAVVTLAGPSSLWDLATLQKMKDFGTSGTFDGAKDAFSPDGKLLGIGASGGGVTIWNVDTGKQVWQGEAAALAFSPDGRYLADSELIDGSYQVALRPPDGSQVITTFGKQSSAISRLVFSPDSNYLAASDDLYMTIWSVRYGEILYQQTSGCLPLRVN